MNNLIPYFEIAQSSDYGKFSEIKKSKIIDIVASTPKKVHILSLEEEIEKINFLISCGWISKVDYKHNESDWVYIEIESRGLI